MTRWQLTVRFQKFAWKCRSDRDNEAAMRSSSIPRPKPLPELHGQDAFLASTMQEKPCVLRGVGRDWPALANWSLASLSERFGEWNVPAVPLRDGRIVVDERRGVVRTMRKASEVLREIEEERGSSYLIIPADTWPEQVRHEMPMPTPCRGAAWVSTNLWVSPKGTTTSLHFDMPHNYLAQIQGTKRILIYERGHFGRMYLERPWSSVPNFSRVDPTKPDFDRFPAFHSMEPFVTQLEPGDVLFLPSATWHHVTSETNSISVNFWWAHGMVAWFARGAHALKRIRGIR